MAYIKIDFALTKANHKPFELNIGRAQGEYIWMEYNLNKSLLGYIIDEIYFWRHHTLRTMDLNDILVKNRNLCTLKPCHISVNENWYNVEKGSADFNKLATFTLYIETHAYGMFFKDGLESLKDIVIGDKLESLFDEIYGQLVDADGWGNELNFEVSNYATSKKEILFPKFKRDTMELVERIGDQ